LNGSAKGFVEAGANVLITSRDEKACAQAGSQLQCHYIPSNVSNRTGCEELANYVGNHFNQQLDVLVNNAGTSWGEPIERDSKTNWGFDKVFDLNVKGMFYLTRACLPLLQHKEVSMNNPSRIINIGSVAGIMNQAAPTHAYDASKAAVHSLTRKFAAEFAPKQITVNAIAPGFIPTRMSSGLSTWGANEEALAKSTPLGRMGNEDDMIGACIYLSSKASSWCTGVILNVDGGCIGAQQIQLSNL
jgi:NAD(P)-dependent dehydrogenase (short-subunit alcohol dehydrogenase family)